MVSDKVKEEWISVMCKDHPKLPRFAVEELAKTYAIDDGEWLKENKKKGEKFARKQAKKGKGKLTEVEQDPDRFKSQRRSRWSTSQRRKGLQTTKKKSKC
jgi:hypothetical protein